MNTIARIIGVLEPKERYKYLALVFARVAINGLDVLGLVAVGALAVMISTGFTSSTQANFFGFKIDVSNSSTFFLTLLIVLGSFLMKSLAGTLLLRLTTSSLASIEGRKATQVAEAVFGGDLSSVEEKTAAEAQWLTLTSSNYAFSLLLYSYANLVSEITLFIAIFLAFLFVDWVVALSIMLFFGSLVFLFQLYVNNPLSRIGQRVAANSVESASQILELHQGFREISASGEVGNFLGRYSSFRNRLAKDAGLQRFVMGVPRYVVESSLMLGLLLVAIIQWAFGNLESGLLTTGIILAGGLRIMGALLPIQNALTDIRLHGPQADKALSILEQVLQDSKSLVPTMKDEGSVLDPLNQPVSVEMKEVCFRFRAESPDVLEKISLSILPGEFVALIGPSGAGKSTILDLILGLRAPTSGSVRLGNRQPTIGEEANFRLAYVPQKPTVFSASVLQNVSLSFGEIRPEKRELVKQCLRDVGLWSFVSSLPQNIDTRIGGPDINLSGGQAQRLAIARALFRKPDLLLLDESTSALDAESESLVTESLKTLRGKVTQVVVAHRLSTVKEADRLIVIEEGKITGEGTFQDLSSNHGLVRKYSQLLSLD